MKKYKAIVFDWDGTLVDSYEAVLRAHNFVRSHFEMEPWTREEIFGRSSQSARETYPRIYGEKSDEALQVLYKYVDANHLNSVTPFPYVDDVLTALKKDGYAMGVVSNKRHAPLIREIAHLKWDRFFSEAVGAGEAKTDKPSAAPLLLILERMGQTPEDVLYVGDTETDLLCAKNAGADCAYIHHGNPEAKLVDTYQPIIMLPALSGLENAI